MTNQEIATVLNGYLSAMGVQSDRIAYCTPFLTGEKPLPTGMDEAREQLIERAKFSYLITYPEAARLIGCSRSSIFRLVKDGTLTPVLFRGRNRVRLADIIAIANGEDAE